MDNIFLFIIWNKALWCKKRIIKDLTETFDILSDVTLNWSSKNFDKNLLALYGRKLGSPEEKITPCGRGPFSLLLVKDKKPKYEIRKMYDGQELVNSHIYDKKMLYRKWTGGCHRIHCSDTGEETLHDLVVLFGSEYIDTLNKESNISIDTKTVIGFNSVNDLIRCLELFGNSKTLIKDEIIYIFSKCRFDIASFLDSKQINRNEYAIEINEKPVRIYIFGELDGDLPKDSFNDDCFDNLVINNLNDYLNYLASAECMPLAIETYANNKHYDLNLKQTTVTRTSKKEPFYRVLIKDIKLLICKIRYSI